MRLKNLTKNGTLETYALSFVIQLIGAGYAGYVFVTNPAVEEAAWFLLLFVASITVMAIGLFIKHKILDHPLETAG